MDFFFVCELGFKSNLTKATKSWPCFTFVNAKEMEKKKCRNQDSSLGYLGHNEEY